MRLSYSEIRTRCLKSDESIKPLYARIVTHTLSTGLVWLFQDAHLSPNKITFVSFLVAVVSYPFFIAMTPLSVLTGALLIEFYYVLDAVDGQWARLKEQKSKTGAFFDALINYAIHPPLLFSIGYGLYRQIGQPLFLCLGFSAAFSCLWVLLIWNVRASVYLASNVGTAHAPNDDAPCFQINTRKTFLREVFGWLHKSLAFPWFMNILTVFSLMSYAIFLMIEKVNSASVLFAIFLIYYGIIGPFVAIAITTYWILSRKLDGN